MYTCMKSYMQAFYKQAKNTTGIKNKIFQYCSYYCTMQAGNSVLSMYAEILKNSPEHFNHLFSRVYVTKYLYASS